MIQYDRLTMVKQLHANTLRPIVGGVIAQNAMPPGGEGLRAVNSQGNRDRAVAIQLQGCRRWFCRRRRSGQASPQGA